MFTVPVHSASQWKRFDWRLHWEKCGDILFFSKILCFLEKSLLLFREKSYFFEKKTRFLSHDFSQYVRSRFLIGGCTGKNVEKFCFSPKFFVFLRNFVFLQNTLFLFLLHSVCLFFLHSVCLFLLHSVCLFLLR